MSSDLKRIAEQRRVCRRRRRKRKRSLHDAPQNSTSFLMADHSDTVMALERSFGGSSSSEEEDETAFLLKEFLRDYNTVRSDRLLSMSKNELINEYVAMESRIERLEGRLAAITEREEAIKDRVHYDFAKGEVPMSPEVAEKIRIFQREIHSLEMENCRLRTLPASGEVAHQDSNSSSSSSSSSDSSSSSSSSSSDSSSSDDSDDEMSPLIASHEGGGDDMKEAQEEAAQDTGYESAAPHHRDEEENDNNSTVSTATTLISDNAVSSSS